MRESRIFYDASAQLLITTTPTDKITLNLCRRKQLPLMQGQLTGTLYISWTL